MTQATIGLVGFGAMGAALALNIAEKGVPIAVWNRTTETTRQFYAEAGELAARILPTESLEALVAAIAPFGRGEDPLLRAGLRDDLRGFGGLQLDSAFSDHRADLAGLRKIVAEGALNGLPAPALGAGLAWFDMARTAARRGESCAGAAQFLRRSWLCAQ